MHYAKHFIVFLLVLFISSIAYADIGPHPSLSFKITNLADYPSYTFFCYSGGGPSNVYPASDSDFVGIYFLDAGLNCYAAPGKIEKTELDVMDRNQVEALVVSSVKSNALVIGEKSQFKVTSFDAVNKTMVLTLVEKNNQPTPKAMPPDILDCSSLSGLLNTYCLFSPAWGIIPIAIVLLVIIVIVFFALKRFKKAKP